MLAHATVRNSDDTSISKDGSDANDIRGFLRAQPSVRRIVFGSGMASARLFARHHRDWLRDGGRASGSAAVRFVLADDDATRACFGGCVKGGCSVVGGGGGAVGGALNTRTHTSASTRTQGQRQRVVELVVPPSVSPACARMPYVEKRNAWLRLVFDRASQ